jgi:hypothetical protein
LRDSLTGTVDAAGGEERLTERSQGLCDAIERLEPAPRRPRPPQRRERQVTR